MASFRIQPEALPDLTTERLKLKLLEPNQAPLMVKFRLENQQFLKPWEPTRPPEFFTEGFWQIQLRAALREFRQGTSVCLALLDRNQTEVLGVCNYTNIVRGTFQACHLGYAMSERHQGKGLMKEALAESTRYIFETIGLNRVMANYLPHNERSGRLLSGLGFVVEGQAKRYLKIDGRWEDHILTSKLNPKGP